MPSGTTAQNTAIPPKNSASPLKIFFALASITFLTLGGGYVIVPVICSNFEKRGWISEERFYSIFARAQAYPGPTALNTSLLVAIELCGLKGAIAAFFGVIIPPFFAILLVSAFLSKFGSLPIVKRFLEGAGVVVPGIVAGMIWKTAKRHPWTVIRAISLAVLTLLLIVFPTANLPILLTGMFVMYCIESLWKH